MSGGYGTETQKCIEQSNKDEKNERIAWQSNLIKQESQN
jgi:hypothetical protein